MVAPANPCDSSTWETVAKGPRISGQLSLHGKTLSQANKTRLFVWSLRAVKSQQSQKRGFSGQHPDTWCVLTWVLSLYLFQHSHSLPYTKSLRPKVETCSWPGRDEDALQRHVCPLLWSLDYWNTGTQKTGVPPWMSCWKKGKSRSRHFSQKRDF